MPAKETWTGYTIHTYGENMVRLVHKDDKAEAYAMVLPISKSEMYDAIVKHTHAR